MDFDTYNETKLKFTVKWLRWLVWLEIVKCGCTLGSHQQLSADLELPKYVCMCVTKHVKQLLSAFPCVFKTTKNNYKLKC